MKAIRAITCMVFCAAVLFGADSVSLVSVPGGTFQMGAADPYGYAAPAHTVTVSSFAMGETEVSYATWKSVIERASGKGYDFSSKAQMGAQLASCDDAWIIKHTASEPVAKITWYDAVKWCNALSEVSGRTPCYYTDKGKTAVYRKGEVALSEMHVAWDADGYRLPTEAEWEYACRGGANGKHLWGSGTPTDYAWYCENSERKTHPVGSKQANGYGLYDMAGNVPEWCFDWFGDYSESAQTDPKGPATGDERIIRGGAFNNTPFDLTITRRKRGNPRSVRFFVGFRVASTTP